MTGKNKSWTRRDFMKIAGATGVGAVVSPMEHLAGAMAKSESNVSVQGIVAKRPFGNSGVDVSILCLGGAMNFMSNQLLLRQAFKAGVTCWDSSRGYIGGKNMENCLTDAAQLGWIDGIMATYNYRLMHTDRMKKAVDACTETGIGLIAMKTQATLISNL